MIVSELQNVCHKAAEEAGWWKDSGLHVVPTKLCLIHSEISEAMEGFRKGANDDHLPNRSAIEVELADAIIRIMDLAGYLDLDLEGAIKEKMVYNESRKDHKPENRAKKGGKKF